MRGPRAALLVTALASAGAAALTGCSGPGSGGPAESLPSTEAASPGAGGAQQLTVHGDDALMFAPASLTAHPGRVQITFVNDGSIAHTLRVNGVEPHLGSVAGHARATLTVALAAGTYRITCDFHPDMVGTLVVS